MIKIQQQKNRTTIWLLPAIHSKSEGERERVFSMIEKLLLRCVIILILKIHYSTTKISRVRKIYIHTSQLFTTADATTTSFSKRLYTRRAIKKISSEINRAIHFLLQIILMLSLTLILKCWMYLKLPWRRKKQRTSLDVMIRIFPPS